MSQRRLPILLFGCQGQVGFELERSLQPLGPVVPLAREDVDLADGDALRTLVRRQRPALIVNAAAHTAVDRAESESTLATAINGTAPGILAAEAVSLGAAFVHFSTDYVFDGVAPTDEAGAKRGFREDDPVAPLGAYGRSKRAGEEAVIAAGGAYLIFRTSWVYAARGRNFLLTMRRLAADRDELRVVDDQIGAPTWARAIADVTANVLAQTFGLKGPDGVADAAGLYHLTAAGQTSWHGFAEAIVAAEAPRLARVPRVVAIPTAEYPTPARRPAWSVLDNARLGRTFGLRLPDWRTQLRLCLAAAD